jgi:uncharacterized protein
MHKKFSNKNILISGGASGIGFALLNRLIELDCRIYLVDLNIEKINQALSIFSEEYLKKVDVIALDISIQENIDIMFDEVGKKFQHIDYFFSCAGFAYYENFQASDWGHVSKIFETNLFSPIYSFQKCRDLNRGNAFTFVPIVSAMALFPMPGYTLYSSTKAALDSFIQGMSFELNPNEKIVAVYPVATKTNFFKIAGMSVPQPWPIQTPDYVANLTLKGIIRNKKFIYTSWLETIYLFFNTISWLCAFSYQKLNQISYKKWLKLKSENSDGTMS